MKIPAQNAVTDRCSQYVYFAFKLRIAAEKIKERGQVISPEDSKGTYF